jgi:hypothetical protein
MGGAFAGVADDAYSIYYNPAGLANVKNIEVPLADNQWLAGIRQQFFGVAYNLHDVRAANIDNLGTIAVFSTMLDTGELIGRDAAGLPTGSFKTKHSFTAISYAKPILGAPGSNQFLAGATVKLVREEIGSDRADNNAFDGGLLWQNADQTAALGVSVLNMGPQAQYIREKYNLPLNIKAGASVRLMNDALLLAADINRPSYGTTGFNLGTEYWFLSTMAVRLGYDTRDDLGSGFTGGFGVSLREVDIFFFYASEITFDYAFLPSGDFDSMHRLSVNLKLGTY